MLRVGILVFDLEWNEIVRKGVKRHGLGKQTQYILKI